MLPPPRLVGVLPVESEAALLVSNILVLPSVLTLPQKTLERQKTLLTELTAAALLILLFKGPPRTTPSGVTLVPNMTLAAHLPPRPLPSTAPLQ